MVRERLSTHRANVYSTIGELIEDTDMWVVEAEWNDFYVTAEGSQKKFKEASMKIISVILYEGVFPPSRKVLDISRKRNDFYVEYEGKFFFVHLNK